MPAPDPASEESILVTLGEGPAGAEVFCGGEKNGSSFHELSTAGGGGGGAAGGDETGRETLLKNCVKLPSVEAAGGGGDAGGVAGAGAAGRAALLKSCVKPPSAEAESEAPGEEKPLGREGPGEGGAGRDVSSAGRAAGV